MKEGGYVGLIIKEFPDSPIPDELVRQGVDGGDIEEGILNHLSSKKWTAINITDWSQMEDVEVVAYYLTPKAFHYYVPSVLIGSLEDRNYLDWGVRAVLPHNQQRKPKGEWWNEFYHLFNGEQRGVVREFLSEVGQVSSKDSQSKYLAELGLNTVWSS